ncbi:MAG TPA: hypothetical protein VK779_04230 [Rhizomicrobium sp.]|jgi:hypothetical protein|nr:hypothetical protein [Rhizomicrobium sp.]
MRIHKAMFVAALAMAVTSAAKAAPPVVQLNDGLEARLNYIGRSPEQSVLSVSMTLTNKGRSIVYLLLAGDPPAATDNAGGMYRLNGGAGIAECPQMTSNWIPDCIGTKTIDSNTAPLNVYEQFNPGKSVTLNFELRGSASKGPLASFSALFAYRSVTDPTRDATLTDEQKRKQIQMLNVSFPPTEVTESK